MLFSQNHHIFSDISATNLRIQNIKMAKTFYYRTKKYIVLTVFLLNLLCIPFAVFDHYTDYSKTHWGLVHKHDEFTFLPGFTSQCAYLIPYFFVCILCVIGLVYDHIGVAFILVIVDIEEIVTQTCVPLQWQGHTVAQCINLFVMTVELWLSFDLYLIWKERRVEAEKTLGDTKILFSKMANDGKDDEVEDVVYKV